MNLQQITQTVWSIIRQKSVDIALYSLIAGIVLKLLSLYFSVQADDDWETFKLAHHCQIQASNGGWLCDDGKVHYRWRQQR